MGYNIKVQFLYCHGMADWVYCKCRFESCPCGKKIKTMKESKYLIKIAGQYVVLTEGQYEQYLIYGIVK